MLRRFRAPVLGVVFTNVPSRRSGAPGRGAPSTETSPDNVVLEGYDAPQPAPASTARLWL